MSEAELPAANRSRIGPCSYLVAVEVGTPTKYLPELARDCATMVTSPRTRQNALGEELKAVSRP